MQICSHLVCSSNLSNICAGFGPWLHAALCRVYSYQSEQSVCGGAGAYIARQAAKSVVASGLARRCLVQISYAIGVAQPLSVHIDTYGTGTVPDKQILGAVLKAFDFRPGKPAKSMLVAASPATFASMASYPAPMLRYRCTTSQDTYQAAQFTITRACGCLFCSYYVVLALHYTLLYLSSSSIQICLVSFAAVSQEMLLVRSHASIIQGLLQCCYVMHNFLVDLAKPAG